MKRAFLSLVLFGVTALASSAARADSWEIVRKCAAGPCDPGTIATTTPVTIKGYSRSLTATGDTEWAYFTIHVDSTTRTRHIVVIPNITDARTAPTFKVLEDAWRTGKKLRFLRNNGRNADPAPTTVWQGYLNYSYTIQPGDRIEFVLD